MSRMSERKLKSETWFYRWTHIWPPSLKSHPAPAYSRPNTINWEGSWGSMYLSPAFQNKSKGLNLCGSHHSGVKIDLFYFIFLKEHVSHSPCWRRWAMASSHISIREGGAALRSPPSSLAFFFFLPARRQPEKGPPWIPPSCCGGVSISRTGWVDVKHLSLLLADSRYSCGAHHHPKGWTAALALGWGPGHSLAEIDLFCSLSVSSPIRM